MESFDDSQVRAARHQTPVMRGWSTAAVVVKDGKKTTVKTMATTQNEQTSSTSDTVQPAVREWSTVL